MAKLVQNRILAVLAMGLISALATNTAEAQFFQGFEAQAGMEFPMSMQVRARTNFPQNWFGVLGLGFSPAFLTDSYSSLASGIGIHGENTAKLVTSGIANNIYMDVRVGYEFGSEESGLYVDFGYSLSTGKGGSTDMDTIEESLDRDFFGIAQTAKPDISTSMHSLTAHVGYTKRLSNSFFLVLEAGLIKPISSSTEVTFDSFVTPANEELVDKEVDDYLQGVISGEMFVPTFAAWVSYLF
ncbi:MAG: hypothetical protein H6624_00365 [Bdellovibrionaceae bacterium]|nr:hypothetical protein [Bdellovibrionales bacterium]MCB9082760.1 hypothetical protein [Pseudobdellovibrionaceae bacterium]